LKRKPAWTVYILRCADGSLYTGITRDVARRVEEHNSNRLLAARYTRSRRPVILVYHERAATRSAACKREYCIKQMTRSEKQKLVGKKHNLPSPASRHPHLVTCISSLGRRTKAS
jgi:putative endonuclease